jgi:hypothetical protein
MERIEVTRLTRLSELGSFLLELLNGSLVNTSTLFVSKSSVSQEVKPYLVDKVTGSGRLSGWLATGTRIRELDRRAHCLRVQ